MTALPSLLFRHLLTLALIAGACAVRAPLFAAVGLGLLVLVPLRRTAKRVVLLFCAFLAGFLLTVSSEQDAPDRPSWLQIRKSVLVEGRIVSAAGLPGGRVRVLLEGLRPVDIPADIPGAEIAAVRKALSDAGFQLVTERA